eukprot:Pgem_evm1s6809
MGIIINRIVTNLFLISFIRNYESMVMGMNSPRGLWLMSNGVNRQNNANNNGTFNSTPNILRAYLIDEETGAADNILYEFNTGGLGLPRTAGFKRYWADNLESTQPLLAISVKQYRKKLFKDSHGLIFFKYYLEEVKYLLALNTGDPSFSIMKINPDLTLKLTFKQELDGLLPCSIDFNEASLSIAVITCAESGTLQLFSFDPQKGTSEKVQSTIDLEVNQLESEGGWPFTFNAFTSPCQVAFCPKGNCVMVLAHSLEFGLQYFPYQFSRQYDQSSKSNQVTKRTLLVAQKQQTIFENENNLPLFIPFGFCLIDDDNIVSENQVMILLTIDGVPEVRSYVTSTESIDVNPGDTDSVRTDTSDNTSTSTIGDNVGVFKLVDSTSAGTFPCWCTYHKGKYYTTNGFAGTMSIGTLGNNGNVTNLLEEVGLGSQYNFGGASNNDEVIFNIQAGNLVVSSPSEGEGKTFLYANSQGVTQLAAFDISSVKKNRHSTLVTS